MMLNLYSVAPINFVDEEIVATLSPLSPTRFCPEVKITNDNVVSYNTHFQLWLDKVNGTEEVSVAGEQLQVEVRDVDCKFLE